MNVTRRTRFSIAAIAAVITAAVGACGGAPIEQHTARGTPASVAPADAERPPASIARANLNLPDFSQLVDQYGPAVVNITVTSQTKTTADTEGVPGLGDNGNDDTDPFGQFFRHFRTPVPRDTPTHGEGSGFIVRADGIVLTNAHVVEDAQQVIVKLTDKREFTAKVLGSDKPSDVAVLKVEAKNLPTVRLGHDSSIRVGQWVVAIGAPFGFDNSVTAGIVSAKQRALPAGGYVPFIQTDVPINPGNSGGPLFNLQGEVVGINSQIYSGTGGYQGLSFAIPIDVAMDVIRQIETRGRVAHGKLGVTIQNVDQTLAEAFGLGAPRGALVTSVDESGPAAHAGLKDGDVILAVDGKQIADGTDLPVIIAQSEPGSTAHLRVWRDRSERSIDIQLGDLNAVRVAANSHGAERGRLGLAVRPLTPEERDEANVKEGLIVEGANGAAADAGIQPGDIVIAANGTPVKSADELRRMVARADRHIALLVQRGEARVYVPITLG